ncbi:MAG: hypothetical protein EOO16_16525 [Chitinophagaceae bacterium]|nr:MAG: hypothetical protein EOO16_16525 [Chitinophagaceae bacterium]
MKKIYTQLLFVLCLLLAAPVLHAQVGVTATVGTATGSYTTLRAAFDAINAGTHKGAIVITISGNTTETVKDSLGPSAGAASYTSVLIKPAANTTPVITSVTPFSTPLIELVGATNVTIDGSNTVGGTTKDLTIFNADTLNATIRIAGGSSNNIIRNSVIKGSPNGFGVVTVSTSPAPATTGNNNNLVENNDITRGSTLRMPLIGIYNTGTSGRPNSNNIYRNNRIFDFSTYGYLDGNGSLGYSNNTLVERNEIFQTVGATGSMYGIQTNFATNGITNMTISRNYIHDLKNTMAAGATALTIAGIDLYDVTSATVVNNMIRLDNGAATSLRGIAQESAGTTVRIYHNTVLLTGTTAGNGSSFAYIKNYTSANDDVRNNMFINTRVSSGTGRQYAILNTSGGPSNVALGTSYNNLVSVGNGSNYVASVSNSGGGNDYQTLATWQTAGQDPNSISVNPTFVSATDLHLQPVAANAAIDNKGVALASVTVDYDGDTRSTTAPDMGADEFAVVANAIASVNAEVSASALWPSVVRSEARLRVVSRQAMSIRWNITDAAGRTVRTFAQPVQSGENFLPLQLEGLQSGAYNITGVTSKGGKINLRFTKF